MGQRTTGAGADGLRPRQKFGGGDASDEDLRVYAQQGDLAALRDLLNQLLAKYEILVHPVPSTTGLNFELGAKSFPKARVVVAEIDQLLVGLQPLPWQSVALVAYRLSSPTKKASEMPAWIERFDIGQFGESRGAQRTSSPDGRQVSGEAKFRPTQTSEKFQPGSLNQQPVRQAGMGNRSVSRSQRPETQQNFPVDSDELCPNQITRESWQALGIGFALAAGLSALGFLRVIFYGFVIMVHELGHAGAHWVFGQPAIPAVNLLFGGGITLSFGQSKLLLLLIYGGLGYLIYCLRGTPRLTVILGALTMVYSFCLWGSWDESLPIFMGHGLEAGAIAICLYLGMSGQLCRFAFDQTIYAMLGWFTLFQSADFAWKLQTDFVTQSIYRDGIGGMLDNDFVKLESSYWGWPLESIALLFLVLCLGAPVVAFLMYRYGAWLRRGWRFLLSPVL